MEPRLRVEGLTKRFGPLVANDAVSFDIRKGELHCLLGENGAGKSTLSACLYGLYRPDGGRIFFDGREVRFDSPSDAIRLGIGMVHQHFVLVPSFTVLENIVVGAQPHGVILDLRGAERRLRGLCERFDLRLDPGAEVGQLSVGEQQWVEILKALYLGAELLILDEPTAVLTPQESRKLFAVIRRMTGDGLSVLLISHKLDEVMQSDRVTVLRRGRLVATVNTGDVTKKRLTTMMVGRAVALEVEKDQPAVPGPPVLEVRNLWARHERGHEVLRGVSLDLRQGEILGIAGVAGNGQNELFETLVGVRRPERGEILLDGRSIRGLKPREIMRRGVGHVPNDRFRDGLVPAFSVSENLILGEQRGDAFTRGPFLDFRKVRAFAEACVSAFGIATPSTETTTSRLSGGNAQKVILARELKQGTKCLLCNQPTRGLDVGVIEYVHRQLLRKRREGVGVLLASEDLDDLLALSDRIAVMVRGEIMGVFEAGQADIRRIGLLMAGHRDRESGPEDRREGP